MRFMPLDSSEPVSPELVLVSPDVEAREARALLPAVSMESGVGPTPVSQPPGAPPETRPTAIREPSVGPPEELRPHRKRLLRTVSIVVALAVLGGLGIVAGRKSPGASSAPRGGAAVRGPAARTTAEPHGTE